MKRLTLIRHAKSCWKNTNLSDFDRPLNKRGKRDLPDMAQRLEDFNITPDLILSSGANRAITTARAIHTQLNLDKPQLQESPELYASCAETLLYLLQNQPDNIQHVMLIGHNPALYNLGYELTQEALTKFPTAAILHMHLSITQWHELAVGCATATLFDYPKKHSLSA